MTICTAKRGETQPPADTKSAEKMQREAQHFVSKCKKHLRKIDRRFVLLAFEGGIISGKEAEAWLLAIDAGERRESEMKALIIDHYSHGKLSAEKVETLFRVLELEGA